MEGAANGRAVINLATGHEDAERVTVAFLVATAGLAAGKRVVMFLTKEAGRLATLGYADAVEAAGAPPVGELFSQFVKAATSSTPARSASTRASSTKRTSCQTPGSPEPPLWEFIGDTATVFSY